MSGPPKAFIDLHRLPEDERITVIGESALAMPGQTVGVPVDDDPGKPERYQRKLLAKYPQLRVENVGRLFKGVVLLRVTFPSPPSGPATA